MTAGLLSEGPSAPGPTQELICWACMLPICFSSFSAPLLSGNLPTDHSGIPRLECTVRQSIPKVQCAIRSAWSIDAESTAPANEAIEYIKEYKFRPALFEKSAYMGFPTDETDRLWKDLYSCELQEPCVIGIASC